MYYSWKILYLLFIYELVITKMIFNVKNFFFIFIKSQSNPLDSEQMFYF